MRLVLTLLIALVLAPAAGAAVVWSADHETGNASQWTLGITKNWDDAACTNHSVVGGSAPSLGNYSMRMTLGSPGGCRQAQLPEAQSGNTYTYAASYYLPRRAHADMWNVFQFKSLCSGCSGSDPMFTVGFEKDPAQVVLNWKGGNTGLAGPFANSGVVANQEWTSGKAVPFKKWVRLEVELDQSTAFDGHIKVWFQGQLLFDFANVRTGYPSGDMRWSVNNYSSNLSTYPYTLWIDNASISSVAAPPPPPPGEPAPIAGQGYTKVFGDEFNGTALDTSVWSPKEFWEDEPRAGAVVVSNGTVKINNARPYYGDQSISTGPYWGLEQAKRSWQFGYFEARMKFTDAKGSWPAFWLLARQQAEWPGYPSCTNRDLNFELDIMEYQGDEPTQFYGTQHRNTGDVCGTPDSTRSVFTQPKKLAGDWHTYSAKWTATNVSWYVDDVLQGTQPLFDSGDQQMVMSLTMQACGWDSTNACTSTTPDPLTTEVDWVHVWQVPAA